MSHDIGHTLKSMQRLGVLATIVLLGGQALGQGTAWGVPVQPPDAVCRQELWATISRSMAISFRTVSRTWIQFSQRTAMAASAIPYDMQISWSHRKLVARR